MTARARVERLLRAARALADPAHPLGRAARAELPVSTRLSPEGVALALTECLEIEPSEAELDALFRSVKPRKRALVLLPANVFVAAHRAIALALSSSETVLVRPSRREPRFVELLARAEPGLFQVVSELVAEPGDALWAYGGDETLSSVRARLPPNVALHAQGPGYGVAVVARQNIDAAAAHSLARDIVPFDQRGCLSPRVALVLGGCPSDRSTRRSARTARAFATRQVLPAARSRRAPVPWRSCPDRDACSRRAGETWPSSPWRMRSRGSHPLPGTSRRSASRFRSKNDAA
jgi:hypothetical protein